jgi:hypothetical protein
MSEISCEEMIEQLKAEFTTVEFLPGTVGFMVRRGEKQIVFPYTVFRDPNFPNIIVTAITILEIG